MVTFRLETPGRSHFLHRGVILGERLKEALNREGFYSTTSPELRYSRINARKQDLLRIEPEMPEWMALETASGLVDSEEQLNEVRRLYDI